MNAVTQSPPAVEQSSLAGAPKQVAFVDTSVAGWQELVAGIAQAQPGIEIVCIAPNEDGLERIAQWASSHAGYSAVHLLGHGAAGTLTLGATRLSEADLSSVAVRDALATLGGALAPGGDLMLYGCETANGTAGARLLATLADLTGADVAGSTDLTGAFARGGDWELEAATGEIETAALAPAAFAGVLANAAPVLAASAPLVFFQAITSGTFGQELWATDGTALGTYQIKDINPGTAGAFPTGFAPVGVNQFVFQANDGSGTGAELWITDGTEAGTVLLKDISSSGASTPNGFTALGDGRVVFQANAGFGSAGTELWITDGTPEGTILLKDINLGVVSSSPGGFTAIGGGKFVFRATDGSSSGIEPWISDGTPQGTFMLKDIFLYGNSSSPNEFVAIGGGRALFTASNGTEGTELWITDGTSAGTTLLKDIAPGSAGSNLTGFTALGDGRFVFSADGEGDGASNELWITDGTAQETKLLLNVSVGGSGNAPRFTALGDGRIVFRANSAAEGVELWITDGSPAGTHLVKDIYPSTASSNPDNFTPLGNGTFLFSANNGLNGTELWISDGTDGGTTLLKDIFVGGGASPADFQPVGDGRFVFRATTTANGVELWITDGTANGTVLLNDIVAGNQSGTPTMRGSTFPPRPVFTKEGDPVLVAPAAIITDDGTTISGLTVVLSPSAGSPPLDGNAEVLALSGTVAGITASYDPGTHTLTLSGAASLADYQAALRLVTYQHTSDDPSAGPRTITVVITDGDGSASLPLTLTLNLAAVNDAPTGAPSWAPPESTEETPYTIDAADLLAGFSDADGDPLAVTGLTSSVGILVDNGDGTWTLIPPANHIGPVMLTYTVSDGQGGTLAAARSIDFAAVNDAPVLRPVAGVPGFFFAAGATGLGTELWTSDGTAAGTVLLKNINPGTGSSSPSNFTALGGGKFVFTANDSTNGVEPWVTDGTEAGTVLLKDIVAGNATSSPANFMATGNGKVLFTADNGTTGAELWVTDGTTAGTALLKDINPGANPSSLSGLTAIGDGKFVFAADNGLTGSELWVTDGTTAGTVLLQDINPGPSASNPIGLAATGDGKVLFRAYNPTTGHELWSTDGTAAGTVLLKDINPGPSASSPLNFTAIGGGKILFTTNDAVIGIELWVTDGTEAGTVLLKDIYPGADSSSPIAFKALGNGKAVFVADDGVNGRELWVTDGTAEETKLLKDINSSTLSNFTAIGNGKVLFMANDGATGTELWVTDGTEAGTELVLDIYPGPTGSSATGFMVVGDGKVMFSAMGSSTGLELWITDGTAAGTHLFKDILPGIANSSPTILGPGTHFPTPSPVPFTEDAAPVFVAAAAAIEDIDSPTLSRLTVTISNAADGTAEILSAQGTLMGATYNTFTHTLTFVGAFSLADYQAALRLVTYENTSDDPTAGPRTITVVVTDADGTDSLPLTFALDLTAVNDVPEGAPGWMPPDGTEDVAYTIQATDLLAGFSDADGDTLAVTGLTASTGILIDNGDGTWTLIPPTDFNGPVELTYGVTDGQGGTLAATRTINLAAVKDAPVLGAVAGVPGFFFTATDSARGTELWTTDGTAAGTVLLKDINPGVTSSSPSGFTALGDGKVLFSANNGTNGSELWVTDGTEAGTVLLKDINPNANASSPANFKAIGDGKVVLTANNGTNGVELWVTDGTTNGTVLLKDINPGGTNSSPTGLTAIGDGKVVFVANNGTNGIELWVTDGTIAGTALLKDINPGGGSSGASNFTAIGGGKVLFSAGDGPNGIEVWITDGTQAGTVLLKDVNSGASSSSPTGFTAIGGGKVVFSAITDTIVGRELWVTDGTDAGTVLLKDINPGADTSSPSGFTALGDGKAVFQANDGVSGIELWVTDGTAEETKVLKDISPGGGSSSPISFTAIGNGKALFMADNGVTGIELWVTDGTDAGTVLLKDINAGASPSGATGFTAVGGGKFAFRANGGNGTGFELWITDGTAAGTQLLKDVLPGAASSSPAILGPGIYFPTPSPALFTEDSAPVFVAAAATIEDIDSPTLSRLTVTISNAADGTAEILSAQNTGIAGITYDTFAHTLTFAGSHSLAQYQAALRLVTYENTSDNPTAGLRTITVVVTDSDGTESPPLTLTLDLAAANDAPVGPLTGTVSSGAEDMVYTLTTADLLDGFSDPEGNTLSVTGLTASAGTLQNTGNGTWTLTPPADFNGPVELTYTVSDGNGGSLSDIKRTVSFAPVNDAPAGAPSWTPPAGTEDVDYIFSTDELLLGFGDLDGGMLAVTGLAASAGTLLDNGNGTWTLTPPANHAGPVVLTYDVTDGNGGTLPGQSRLVTFAPVNDAPAGAPGWTPPDGTEDTAYTIRATDLLDGFSDAEGDTLTVTGLTASAGILVKNADGTWTLTPPANYFGPVALTYTVSDGQGGTLPGSRSIDIAPVNDAPALHAEAGMPGFYFTANDGAHGSELWFTDGIEGGETLLLKDINPGAGGSSPASFTALGDGRYVFQANGGSTGIELWVTDGTAGGTVLLKDINPGGASSSPTGLTAIGDGKALFSANNGTNGIELWVTDGTAAGTVQLEDINPGTSNSFPDGLTALGDGRYVFQANGAFAGIELWVTDGTETGTFQVKDINLGPGASNPSGFTAIGGGKAVFQADGGSTSVELWITDGTTAGTVLLKDIHPTNSSVPTGFTALGDGRVLFSANDPTNGTELWITDGTTAGTVLLKDVNPGGPGSGSGGFTAIGGGKAVFTAMTSALGRELWATDGTTAGTVLLKDIYPGGGDSTPSGFTVLGDGKAVFSANDSIRGNELWFTNGTAAGTVLLKDINPGATGSSLSGFTEIGGGRALFQANNLGTGTELWVTDGTAIGTVLLKDIIPGGGSSTPLGLTAVGDGKFAFRAGSISGANNIGTELWITDGTPGGTVLLADLNPGAGSSNAVILDPGTYFPTPSPALFTEGSAPVFVAAAATIEDIDSPTLSRLAVTISDATDGAAEILSAQGTVMGATYNTFTHTLTFTGAFSLADYQAALRLVTYENTSDNPSTSPRTITVVVTDSDGIESPPLTLALDLAADNDAPTGTPGWAPPDGVEDTPYTISAADLLLGFSDPEGGTLTVAEIAGSIGFEIVDNGDGTWTVTPPANFNGTEMLGYWVSDGQGGTRPASVTINFTQANDAPVGAPGWTPPAGTEDVAYSLSASDLLLGFSDLEGDALSVTGLTASTGTLLDHGNGTWTFTPPADFNGAVELTYAVSDGQGGTLPDVKRTVTFTPVNDAPAGPLTGTLSSGSEDMAYIVTAANLLDGISDPDDDTLSVTGLTASAGNLVDNGNGTWTLTPPADFNGQVELTYAVSDPQGDTLSGIKRTVTLAPVNDAPAGGPSWTPSAGTEDAAYTIKEEDLLLGFSDLEGDALFVTGLTTSAGTLVNEGDGTWTLTPPANHTGPVTLTYAVTDGNGGTLSGQSRTVSFTPVNDAPVGPLSGTLSPGSEDAAYTIRRADLLDGFSDPDGDPLSVTGLTASAGILVSNADGTWTLIPPPNYFGPVELAYTVSDGQGGTLPGTRSIAIAPVNDAPVLRAQAAVPGFYFTASDGEHGSELWFTDGTEGGTVLLKDINPGPGASSVNGLMAIGGGKALFSAITTALGRELWVTDGTEAGTVLLKDIAPGTASSFSTTSFADIGSGKAVFAANNGTGGTELWITDGTTGGTVLLKDINPGSGTSSTAFLTAIGGGKAVFQANDGSTGVELWITDGTTDGTVRLKDINSLGTDGSNPSSFTAIGGGKVLFTASDSINGNELWVTDGTEAGTVLVENIAPGADASSPNSLTAIGGGKAMFVADDGSNGRELWITDGTEIGTYLVKDINSSAGISSSPNGVTATGEGTFVFAADDGVNGRELWITDGTEAGTRLVKNINANAGVSSSPSDFRAIGGGKVLFSANDGINGSELWVTDGTEAGTKLVLDINPGGGSNLTGFMALGNGKFAFRATSSGTGTELWITDGTPEGTHLLANLNPGAGNSTPSPLGPGIYFPTPSPALFTEGSGPVLLAPAAIIQDSDNTTLSGLTVTLASAPDGAAERLSADGSPFGISSIYNPATRTLTLTGAASLATYQDVLRSLAYDNTSENPSTATRTITVTITDGGGTASSPLTLTLDLAAVNDAPVGPLTGTLSSGSEDAVYTFTTANLLDGISDPEGGPLTMAGLTASTGTLLDLGNDKWALTPPANFNDAVELTYVVLDTQGSTLSGIKRTVPFAPVNDALVGAPSWTPPAGTEDVAYTLSANDLLLGFSDPDGDTLSVTGLTASTGTLVNMGNGTWTLTRPAHFNGVVELTYEVSDGKGSNISGVKRAITFTPVNDAPVGPPGWAPPAGAEDNPYTFKVEDLLLGFSDPDGNTLTVTGLTASAGTLVNMGNGTWTLTPLPDFNGPVALTYTVSDGQNGGLFVNRTITFAPVNDAPLGAPQWLPQAGTEDTPYIIRAANLLDGFRDSDHDTLTVQELKTHSGGTLTDNHDGTWTFTPQANFNGWLMLTYDVADGHGGILRDQFQTISFNAVNDLPVGAPSWTPPAGTESNPYTIFAGNLLLGFSDPDGNALAVMGLTASAGTLADMGNGTWTLTPPPNFSGAVELTYAVSDLQGGILPNVKRTVTFGPANDPPVGVPGWTPPDGIEDTPYTIRAEDLLLGFSDPDGDTLTVILLTASAGSLVDNGDGTWTLTPPANHTGPVTLTYGVTDGHDGPVRVQFQTVSFTPVNDEPAGPLTGTLPTGVEDVVYIIHPGILLNGFSDPDRGALAVTGITASAGTLVHLGNGNWALTPPADFNGAVELTYAVSDSQGGALSGVKRTVTFAPVNDAPVGPSTGILSPGTEDTAYTISIRDLLNGFRDPEGGTLTVEEITTHAGTLTDNLDGTWTLVPRFNFSGELYLTYKVSDSQGLTFSAVRTVLMAPVNDAPSGPLMGPPLPPGIEDRAYIVDSRLLSEWFIDPDGFTGPLAVMGLTASAGTVVTNDDGTWTLTPPANHTGLVTLTYAVSDGEGGILSGITRTVSFAPVNDAPVGALTGTLSPGLEDTVYIIRAETLLGGLSDPDGNALAVMGLSASAGTLVHLGNGTWALTPPADFHGAVELTYAVSDSQGDLLSGVARTVTFASVNDAPIGPLTGTLSAGTEDTAYTLSARTLLDGFSDPEGGTLTVTGLATDAGTLTDNHDGTWTLIPRAHFNGQLALTYTVSDGQNLTAATRAIAFTPVNDAPIGAPGWTPPAGTENMAYTLSADDLLRGFSDPDRDALAVTGLTASAGTLVDNGDGTWTLIPPADFSGEVELTYTVSDGHGGTLSGQSRTISFTDADDVPSGTPSWTPPAGTEDVAYTISADDLLRGFSDPNGDALAVTGLTVSAGTLADNGDGTWTLTPPANHAGPVTLTYGVTDGHGGTLSGQSRTVSFTPVNDAPVGAPGWTPPAGTENVAYTFSANDLLRGFSDPDRDVLTVTRLTASAGTLADNGDGTWTLTPPANHADPVTLTYAVTDGRGGTIFGQSRTVSFTDADDVPVGAPSWTPPAGTEDVAYTLSADDLLRGFSDPNGDVLAVTGLTVSAGTLADNGDGTWTLTPPANHAGPVTLTYGVTDGHGGILSGQSRTVSFTPVNDTPVGAPGWTPPDATENVAYTFSANDLLRGFSDPDRDALAVTGLTASAGTLVDNGDGTWTLTPPADFSGEVELTYTVSDGQGGTLSGQSRTISFADADDVPSGAPSWTPPAGTEDVAYTLSADDLLRGFSDPNGDALAVTGLTVSAGALADNGDGTWTLTPPANHAGPVTLTYGVTDGHGGTLSGQSRIVSFTPVNDAPVGAPGWTPPAGTENAAYTLSAEDLLDGFSDPDGDALAVTGLTVSAGTLADNGDGTWTLAPPANHAGPVTLTYGVTDGHGGTLSGQSRTVSFTDEKPIGVDDAFTIAEDAAALLLNVLANDTGGDKASRRITQIDGAAIAIGEARAVDGGTVELTADGQLRFAPSRDYNGEASFTYGFIDGTGAGAVGHVIGRVTPVNDAPVALTDSFTVPAGGGRAIIDVLANDGDPDPDAALVISAVEDTPLLAGGSVAVRGGRITLGADQKLIFIPNAGFEGSVTFSYTVRDEAGLTAVATATSSAILSDLIPSLEKALEELGLGPIGKVVDLLHEASVVAPGAFHDITHGSAMPNRGYEAGPGAAFDIDTDLASIDRDALIEALVTIAANSAVGDDIPVLFPQQSSGWASAGNQSLVFQTILAEDMNIRLGLGGDEIAFAGLKTMGGAWSREFAQQSLSADLSADVARQYDGQAQGHLRQETVAIGSDVFVEMGGHQTDAPQAGLTNKFGFVDFIAGTGDSAVDVARPVMTARMMDEGAHVSLRQNGANAVEVQFYKVDDYVGTIDGVRPGDAGYAVAADTRAYHTAAGETWIKGAGYGEYSEANLADVKPGDLVVMRLFNGTDYFYAFADANETVGGEQVGHVWNYGHNIWGWEDLYGGGDQDFNDLVVKLDFLKLDNLDLMA